MRMSQRGIVVGKICLYFRSFSKMGVGLLFVLFLFGTANGQQNEITGTVSNSEGESLPGVTIMLVGTETGTVSDLEGNYSITAPSDGVLVFSFIGYVRVEENIDGRTTIDIIMDETVAELQELVVTGYTAQRRADITGAVSSLDIESMGRQTSSSVLQRLDGQVPGVTVQTSGSPGARSSVRIRGVSSFQNNDPLYIIDGTPVEDSFANWLNPNDIESVQVLKDASAASIYGSRANNGVVIIETKKGQAGSPQINLNMKVGVNTPVGGYNDFLIQDPLEYAEVERLSHVNAGLEVPRHMYGDPDNPTLPNYTWPNDGVNQTNDLSAFGMTEDDYFWPDNLIIGTSEGTDWWDAVFGPALVQDFDLGVSGGGEDYRYNVSFNYYDQEGTAAYNRFQRGSIRVNTQFDMGRLTVGENIAVTLDEMYGGMASGMAGEGGIVGKNILIQPIIPVYDIAGNFAAGKAPGQLAHSNPLKIAYYNKDDITQNNRIVGNAFARFNVMDNLLVNSRLGFNVSEGHSTSFSPMFPEDSEPSFEESIGENWNRFRSWTWTNTVNFVDTFAERHNINILAGQEATQNRSRNISGSMGGLITNVLDARYIQDAIGDPDQQNVSSFGSVSTLVSFFGKVDYNFSNRYYASLTLRRDGSSRFGPENRWGTFPAFSVGWRVSEEGFMAGNVFITNLMFRYGWGLTGNQAIPAGRTVDQFGGSTNTTFYDIRGTGSSIIPGYRQTALGNPDLRWEENRSQNIGVDVEFMEGRFSLAVDVFERETDNLLFAPPVPASASQAAAPVVNIGMMRNRGIDFTLGYRGSSGSDLSWNVTFNGTHYKNEILRIDGAQQSFRGPASGRQGEPVINMVGHSIGSFYGLIQDGIFQNQAEIDELDQRAREISGDPEAVYQDGAAPGRFRFRDITGNGQVTLADRTIIGNPHPDFTGGLNLGIGWRNWDLSAFIFGSFGNDIFEMQKEFYVFRNFNFNVRRDRLTDAAVVENGQVINQDAKYPEINSNDTFSDQISSFYVEDGSYVRLRNLQVGYNIPPNVLPGFRNLRIYVMAENLFTITGYPNIDPALPAINTSGNVGNTRDQSMGIDRGTYPANKNFSLGISAGF